MHLHETKDEHRVMTRTVCRRIVLSLFVIAIRHQWGALYGFENARTEANRVGEASFTSMTMAADAKKVLDKISSRIPIEADRVERSRMCAGGEQEKEERACVSSRGYERKQRRKKICG